MEARLVVKTDSWDTEIALHQAHFKLFCFSKRILMKKQKSVLTNVLNLKFNDVLYLITCFMIVCINHLQKKLEQLIILLTFNLQAAVLDLGSLRS